MQIHSLHNIVLVFCVIAFPLATAGSQDRLLLGLCY